MTETARRRRLATIKRIARRHAYFESLPDQGSFARTATPTELAELERHLAAVGGEWAARQRGILTADRQRPSKGLHGGRR
jgi:hypothetical protein